MAPKAKNVAGSKQSRKGEASGSKNWEPIQKFGKKAVEWYESTARWEHSKDTKRHNTLYFANFNQVAKNNMRCRFCYGGLITRFLRTWGIKEEAVDLTIAFHPDLTGVLISPRVVKKS
ncbi:hypothetical protein H5410_022965 [Solanum commersonii]|uniref:Uncharacterized protein n=1 Tax=Solanum commersonii TaxID=4109 RepID=A0A9J5ZIY4_SOLCO|nr:hypothetical protein H5410_022965 [Solanum commersonii]